MLDDGDRRTIYGLEVEIRDTRVALTEATKARLTEARYSRQSALATGASRIVMAAIIGVGIWGGASAYADRSSAPTPVLTRVATHSDALCIESDLAVLLEGAPPSEYCPLPSVTTVPKG